MSAYVRYVRVGNNATVDAMLPSSDCSVETVRTALDTLAGAAPNLKKEIIAACVACIVADGRTSVEQSELLQAVADSLDCPMPIIDA